MAQWPEHWTRPSPSLTVWFCPPAPARQLQVGMLCVFILVLACCQGHVTPQAGVQLCLQWFTLQEQCCLVCRTSPHPSSSCGILSIPSPESASSPEPGTQNSRARRLLLHHMGKERSRKKEGSSSRLSFFLSLKVEFSPGLMDQRGNIVIPKSLDLADPRGVAQGQSSVLERVAGTFRPQHQRGPEIFHGAHISRLFLGREGGRPTSDPEHLSAAGTAMPSMPRSCHHRPPPSTSYIF